jgi:hypothetical protein
MSLGHRLSELEAAMRGMRCPTCGRGGDAVEDPETMESMKWWTESELRAVIAIYKRAAERLRCPECRHDAECPAHPDAARCDPEVRTP